MRARIFLRLMGAVLSLTVMLGGVAPRASAQDFVYRKWLSGLDPVSGAVPAWSTSENLGVVSEGGAFSRQLSAADADSYASSDLPPWLSLSPSGSLSGAAPEVSSSTDFNFQVGATNEIGSSSRAFSLRVLDVPDPPAWITSADLGQVNEGPSVSITVSATGADSYSVSSGALPAGLTLNSNTGVISGSVDVSSDTPYSFGVDATNTAGTSSRTFQLVVHNVEPPPAWNTAANLGIVDELSSVSKVVGATGATSYQIVSGTLPTGLSLNTASGAITGTLASFDMGLNQNVEFDFTIRASGAGGDIDRLFMLFVRNLYPPPVWVTATNLGQFTKGSLVSINLVATSEAKAVTYRPPLTPVGWPIGWSVSSAGLLTGTAPNVASPTTYTSTVRADNAGAAGQGGITERTFTVTIVP